MATVMARFETAHASRYLEQLCRHFGRMLPTRWTPEKGSVRFVPGTASLEVRDGALMVECDADSEDQLAILVRLVEAHLEQLARSESVTLVWLEDGRPADALNARVRAMSEMHNPAWDEDDDTDAARPTIH
jgi:hypothetical protein